MSTLFEKKAPSYIHGSRFESFRGYPPMFHAHVELIYLKKGSIRTTIDGVSHTLQAGELCVLFPYLTHSYEDGEAEGLLLMLDPAITVFQNTLLSKKPLCHHIDGRVLSPLLERAVDLLKIGRVKTATAYLNAVIGELLEVLQLADSQDTAGNMAVKVLEYCAENFSRPLTLQMVADALFISQSYVSKIFSDKLRYNFREYINSLRIRKAKELLSQSSLPMSEIMFVCGFSNQSSFNRVFREFCGCTPREYKKSVK